MLAGRPQEKIKSDTDEFAARDRLNEIYHELGWGLTWLEPLGFNTREQLIVLEKTNKEHHIENISDLAKKSDRLSFAGDYYFFKHEYGFRRMLHLGDRYNKPFLFKTVTEVDFDKRYNGPLNKEYDVTVGWTTDPEFHDKEFVVINDDEFPRVDQFAIPLCRTDLLQQGKIKDALEHFRISEQQMIDLNEQARVRKNTPDAITKIVDQYWTSKLLRKIQEEERRKRKKKKAT